MALFLGLLNSALLEPVPYNPYIIATNSMMTWSLFPMVPLSFHQPVSSLALIAILLLILHTCGTWKCQHTSSGICQLFPVSWLKTLHMCQSVWSLPQWQSAASVLKLTSRESCPHFHWVGPVVLNSNVTPGISPADLACLFSIEHLTLNAYKQGSLSSPPQEPCFSVRVQTPLVSVFSSESYSLTLNLVCTYVMYIYNIDIYT